MQKKVIVSLTYRTSCCGVLPRDLLRAASELFRLLRGRRSRGLHWSWISYSANSRIFSKDPFSAESINFTNRVVSIILEFQLRLLVSIHFHPFSFMFIRWILPNVLLQIRLKSINDQPIKQRSIQCRSAWINQPSVARTSKGEKNRPVSTTTSNESFE